MMIVVQRERLHEYANQSRWRYGTNRARALAIWCKSRDNRFLGACHVRWQFGGTS